MAIVRLNDENETVMALLRDRLSPKLAGAVSAILFSKEQINIPMQTRKLHDAIELLVEEIVDIDPRTGLKIKGQIEKLLGEAMRATTQATPLAPFEGQIVENERGPQFMRDIQVHHAPSRYDGIDNGS